MQTLDRIRNFARKPDRQKLRIVCRKITSRLPEIDWYWKVHSPGDDRTTYIIGLFGTGRLYLNHLVQNHIGARAKYFRDTIRLHQVPTSMIYSGHATLKHVSRAQAVPAVTRRILDAVRARLADRIFLYRHPLDSLITNWVFWRTYLRTEAGLSVALAYKNTDDLCVDLEKNFAEFETFAAGDPAFFAGSRGPRFLSFQEFVEETELHLQSASLTLRLEDFTVSPTREFSRIANVMSIDLNLNGSHIPPPHTRPYRYLELKERVPRFKSFIARLDAETQRRIGSFGYSVS
jgi:hypothetical protein